MSLASLKTDINPLTPEECETIDEMLKVLAPFELATIELSTEKRVSGSKVIPMMKMVNVELQRQASTITKTAAQQLAENLRRQLTECISNMESLSVMTQSTLLDPRFKTLGFVSTQKAAEAVRRLKMECADEMRNNDQAEGEPCSSHGPGPSSGTKKNFLFVYFCGTLSCDNKLMINYFLRSQSLGNPGQGGRDKQEDLERNSRCHTGGFNATWQRATYQEIVTLCNIGKITKKHTHTCINLH